jgi:hypothetical protein
MPATYVGEAPAVSLARTLAMDPLQQDRLCMERGVGSQNVGTPSCPLFQNLSPCGVRFFKNLFPFGGECFQLNG